MGGCAFVSVAIASGEVTKGRGKFIVLSENVAGNLYCKCSLFVPGELRIWESFIPGVLERRIELVT